jgi:predicted small lipoprotein YifL
MNQMKFKKSLCLVLMIFLTLSACGKKGPLKYPGEQKRPKFENVVDEE